MPRLIELIVSVAAQKMMFSIKEAGQIEAFGTRTRENEDINTPPPPFSYSHSTVAPFFRSMSIS